MDVISSTDQKVKKENTTFREKCERRELFTKELCDLNDNKCFISGDTKRKYNITVRQE
jgi:hypothetical protein